MRSYSPITLISFFFLSFFYTTSAQDIKKITGNFEGYSFTRMATEIEANSGYHFYFDPSETDSLVIHLRVRDISMQELLEQLFSKTDFHYAIDTLGRVFVSRHFSIQTALPPNFFSPGNAVKKPEENIPVVRDKETPEKSLLKVSSENKVFEIGSRVGDHKTGSANIAGYIRAGKTGESVIDATIFIDSPSIQVNSDQFGYYSMMIPKGRHLIKISGPGMKEASRQIILNSDGKLDIELQENIASLKTVIVSVEKSSNVKSVQMGIDKLDIKTIKQLPSVLGETDILKTLLTLPGVTSVGEASNGFNVRGGSTDQNLILFNDETIYNPSHLFGFFSAFNPDVVKGIELYKSAIPEKYGGRLSSVLDVSIRDGNSKSWSGSAGIGPMTSKFMIEGPIKKERTSIIAAVRTTYSDWLLNAIPNNMYSNSKANFYDANLHISHILDGKNTLYLTGYISNDKFNLNSDTTYRYSNMNANLKWKHIFSNKTFAVFTAGLDHYQYDVSASKISADAFDLAFSINQSYFRGDFTYRPTNEHVVTYGLNSIYYKLSPGSYKPLDAQSLVKENIIQAEQALETAIYLGDQYAVTDDLSIHAGIRYSVFNYLGAHSVFSYVQGLPRETATIRDTTNYPSGKTIKTYQAPEIRISARYSLSDNTSLKLSYNSMQQYIHMLSNTTAVSPTDIWKLSDPNIRPQQGNQWSLGFYKNLKSNTIETSVEVYYKEMKNYMDYKSGASLVLNSHIETDVFTTRGKAYGVELLLKKNSGKLNGWISYTYSRTLLKQDDALAGETINKGSYYPASFDKPHNVNFIGNYRFSHRLSLSLNIVYSTGRPITLPLSVFNLDGTRGLFYSDRNQYRIPDYFRSDIAVNLEGNHRIKKVSHNFWSMGIYNVTGRQNAYSVYFIQENGKVNGYQLSIFGTLIPFITYNIKF